MLFIRGPLLYVLLYGVHSSVIDLHHQLVPGSSSTAIKVPLKCDRRLNVIYNFSKRFSSPEKCEFENHSRDITWIFTVVNVYQNEYGGDGVWVLSFIYFFFCRRCSPTNSVDRVVRKRGFVLKRYGFLIVRKEKKKISALRWATPARTLANGNACTTLRSLFFTHVCHLD